MISIARNAGIPVEIHHEGGNVERIGFDSNPTESTTSEEAATVHRGGG